MQARSSLHRGGKRQLLGNPATIIAPAWKVNAQAKGEQWLQESRILLSRLPVDVGDAEVEVSNPCWLQLELTLLQELFKKTVGPVKVRNVWRTIFKLKLTSREGSFYRL